jgi:hypothetical protein
VELYLHPYTPSWCVQGELFSCPIYFCERCGVTVGHPVCRCMSELASGQTENCSERSLVTRGENLGFQFLEILAAETPVRSQASSCGDFKQGRWHCDMFFFLYFGFPLSVTFHQCCIPTKQQCFFRNRGALDRQELRLNTKRVNFLVV